MPAWSLGRVCGGFFLLEEQQMAKNKAATAQPANPAEFITDLLQTKDGIFKSDPESIQESTDELIRCVTTSDMFLENDTALAGSVIHDILAMRDACLAISKFYEATHKQKGGKHAN